MSIIYEALKKVEVKSRAIALPSFSSPKRQTGNKRQILLLAVAVVIFLIAKSITPAKSHIFQALPLAARATPNEITPDPDAVRFFAKETLPEPEIAELKTQEAPRQSVKLHIQGIIYDVSSPVVLVNGFHLHVGDSIGNAKVLNIFPEGIEIQTEEGKSYIPWEDRS